MQRKLSVVEYQGSSSGHRCGYCKSSTSNYSHGMWAHILSVEDYQALINRGWRRSGQYCYKPNNRITCCPLYTIKCDAENFKLNKSHKKILKRMNKFLRDGKREKGESNGRSEGDQEMGGGHEAFQKAPKESTTQIELDDIQDTAEPTSTSTKESAAGPDPTKVPAKKAKQLKLEHKMAKIALKGGVPMEASCSKNPEKSLEDFLGEVPQDGSHKLELKLVPSSKGVSEEVVSLYRKYQVAVHDDPPSKISELKLVATDASEFAITLEEEYKLFGRYQTKVHDDPPEGIREFQEFLVDSPMKVTQEEGGPPEGYGSFHQQYWLDSKLIAVAVIDILPECVSSVYFFYDPDYSFLSLGTYSSLREVALTRELSRTSPALRNYYMGFYIHSCPKMRYKGKLKPSYLLCPEIYSWHLLDDTLCQKLDQSKYQRFNESTEAKDADVVANEDVFYVKVLYRRSAILYGSYLEKTENDDLEEVSEYANLVGKTSAFRMLLYRE